MKHYLPLSSLPHVWWLSSLFLQCFSVLFTINMFFRMKILYRLFICLLGRFSCKCSFLMNMLWHVSRISIRGNVSYFQWIYSIFCWWTLTRKRFCLKRNCLHTTIRYFNIHGTLRVASCEMTSRNNNVVANVYKCKHDSTKQNSIFWNHA